MPRTAIEISFRVSGLSNAIRLLNRSGNSIIAPRMREVGAKLLKLAREEVPKRSKRLMNSLHIRVTSPTSLQLVEGEDYGYFVRRGTSPHPIYPRFKKALWWPGLGHPIAYVRRHPGTKPNPYHIRALDRLGLDGVAMTLAQDFDP